MGLVAIDDESVSEIGRFPWSRREINLMTEKILGYGAKSVAFDIIFSEPDLSDPLGDKVFAKTVQNHSDRVILGTFSENRYPYLKYQNHCLNEAFKATVGPSLVKLNSRLTIEAPDNELNWWNWGPFFSTLFSALQEQETKKILEKNKQNGIEKLSNYQKKSLNTKLRSVLFEYCQNWLTPEDVFLSPEFKEQVDPLYKGLASEKDLSVDEVIKKIKQESIDSSIPHYGDWTANIPELQEVASYTAGFASEPDEDGFIRRYPLLYRTGDRVGLSYIPSLALQSYLVATESRAQIKLIEEDHQLIVQKVSIFNAKTNELIVDIPTDHQGRILIKFYGPRMSLPHLPAQQFFQNDKTFRVQVRGSDRELSQTGIKEVEVDRHQFSQDKSFIVGATAVGLYDLQNTPVEPHFHGPEIHLTALANLISQDHLRESKNERNYLPWIVFGVGLLLSSLWAFSGLIFSSVSFLIILLVLITVDIGLFIKLNLVWNSIFLYIMISAIFFVIQLHHYFVVEKSKKKIRSTFEKYMAPSLIEALLKDQESLKLGGRREHMTVFFSDIRDFTSISEKLEPEALASLLNSYLTPMTEVIFKNRGTLDKYIGDAIMAFFGAPVKMENHALDACRCALESQAKLQDLQKDWESKGLPRFEMGIGINTGEMSVGNMGSSRLQSYTVIGDPVNLASRLEGLTKIYGVGIIVSEFTYDLVKSHFISRELDVVRVKGRVKPVRIYQLLDETETSELKAKLDLYHQAYNTYLQQNFGLAKIKFEEVLKLWGHDPVSKLFIQRCDELIADPPASPWDGIYTMKTK